MVYSKKAFAIFFVIIFVFSLVACSKKEGKSKLNPDNIESNIKLAVLSEMPITYYNHVVKPKRTKFIKKCVIIGVPVVISSLVATVASSGSLAPVVGTWIGSTFMGFHGIAATNAGLALLGGGAVGSHALAFGMAGGTTVIVTSSSMLSDYAATAAIIQLTAASDNEYHKRAEKELKSGNEAMARSLYRESIQNSKDILKSYFVVGVVELKNRNYAGATEIFQKIIKYSPESSMVILHLGLSQLAIGKIDDGIATIKEAVSKEPKWDEPYISLYQAYTDNGEESKAFETLMSGVKLNSKSYELNYQAGIAFSNKSDWNAAIECFTSAVEIGSKRPDARLLRALAYRKTGDKKAALKDFLSVDKILKGQSPYGLPMEIGGLYLEMGDEDNGYKYIEKARRSLEIQLADKKDPNLEKVLDEISGKLKAKKPSKKSWWKVWG
jgi:tetratricopeptide (TPR) repeat protein/uncharacterized membrane protein YtjA (UPF0391 family)